MSLYNDFPHYNSADVIEDSYSPRAAARDFVTELVRKRGIKNLQKFMLFIVEIFKRYVSIFLVNSVQHVMITNLMYFDNFILYMYISTFLQL